MQHKPAFSIVLMLAILLALLTPSALAQNTLYVDDDAPQDPGPGNNTVSDPLEDGTFAHPFDMVQEGIDAAVPGDLVLVLGGDYLEIIDFKGKAIEVKSVRGSELTTIDGGHAGSAVKFISGEGPGSVLDGFTITNGLANHGGGITCDSSSPTIKNCLIFDNEAYNGGGIHCSNSASPTIINCLIRDNEATAAGGGIGCATSTSPTIINCTITENTADLGGGIQCNSASPTVRNSIVWGNNAPTGPEILGIATVDYSCISTGWSSGTGNISQDPLFDDPANPTTPSFLLHQDPCQPGVVNLCVDGGDPQDPIVTGTTRTDGEQDALPRVDMGYHYQLPLGVVWYIDDDAPQDPGPGNNTVSDPLEDGTFAHPFDMVQEGIDAAVPGDLVLVLGGDYLEIIDFKGKAIEVKSVRGSELTTIDGGHAGSAVKFISGEGPGSVLDGFTITNGLANHGGGITCDSSSPTIKNCLIFDNEAYNGGGIHCSNSASPTIINCLIRDNEATAAGGGIGCATSTSPTIINCTITENTADLGGGIQCNSASPTVRNSIVWGNNAPTGPEILGIATVDYSCISTGWSSGTGNISQDPLFVAPTVEDFSLVVGSPCVDAGDSLALAPFEVTTDLAGARRIVDVPGVADTGVPDGTGAVVDIGAYECQSAHCQPYCGSSINMDTYTVVDPFVLGGTFQGTVGFPSPNFGAVVAGYLGRLTFPIWGQEGLVNVATPEVMGVPTAFGPSPVTISWAVPNEPAYAGFHVYTQAAGFGGGVINLTCAYDCIVGY